MEHLLVPFECRDLPPDAIALVLAPHPDDEVFGCGGTIALHVAGGGRASVILLTAGDAGGDATARLAESAAAAAVLGLEPPECWQLGDREVQYGERLVERIVDAIRRRGATVLFAPSLWEVHPDHRAAALAAIEAVRRHGGCDLMAYEVGAPLRPNRLVDITPELDTKRRAVACFASQFTRQRYDLQMEGLNRYRTYTLPEVVQAAEAFEHVAADRIAKHVQEFFRSEYQRQRDAGLMLSPEEMTPVTVAVRGAAESAGLHATLDSIAAQTWGRIEVLRIAEAGATVPEPVPAWCGRFPLRRADVSPPSNVGSAEDGSVLLCLDAGETLVPSAVAEAVRAISAVAPSAAAVLLAQRRVDDAVPDEAGADPMQHWRRDVRVLLDPQRSPIALFRCAALDATLTTRLLAGSRASDPAVWATLFAREALCIVEHAGDPLAARAIGSGMAATAAGAPAAAFSALVGELPDAALERLVAAAYDGMQQPWAQAILDAHDVAPGSFLERIRAAAQQAAQCSAAAGLLGEQHVPGANVADRARRAAQAYGEWSVARDVLLGHPGLSGDDWADRLRQACRAAERLPALQHELDAMRASRSWALTAPLRCVGALVRRARTR
jgi:LmbE family N-acetylglucosaminyl deacetylase